MNCRRCCGKLREGGSSVGGGFFGGGEALWALRGGRFFLDFV